nr:aminotransferase class III-fold pyridoxal phosphate-dependent enzyme [Komagataeibacter sp. FNDCF1]
MQAAARFWNPDKVRFWEQSGVPLMIGRREGYLLYDLDGREVIDVHLNGGTYNLGHRHPELVAALREAVQHVDIGNHHFPSPVRSALAQALLATTGANMRHVAFVSTGSEAIDLAIKSARYATGRRVIVSVRKAYHGHTGLAVATGDARFSQLFHSDRPDEFRAVPFNDVSAMEAALSRGDVAAVIMETIPATYGFPMPQPGYLEAVASLCARHGSLYVADEVQTGLMRTGCFWAIDRHALTPDILVTAKGLGGGLYPVAALVMDARSSGWLEQDGFAHMSTFGGSELGCFVALRVIEMTRRVETRDCIARNIAFFHNGLARIQQRHPQWLTGIRQAGLVIGLEFHAPDGAVRVMHALFERGVWAIFSTLDPRVLQFKPGLLLDQATGEAILDRLEAAVMATDPAMAHAGGRV